MELEAVSVELQRLALQPGEVLVIRVPDALQDAETIAQMRTVVKDVLARNGMPNDVMVMPMAFQLTVVSN